MTLTFIVGILIFQKMVFILNQGPDHVMTRLTQLFYGPVLHWPRVTVKPCSPVCSHSVKIADEFIYRLAVAVMPCHMIM